MQGDLVGGVGCFGKFAPRLQKLNTIYVLFAADRFVHLHIKFDVCLIKDTLFCLRFTIVSTCRRPAGPVELYTVFSGAVHIKIKCIGLSFIALFLTRLAQEAVE